jgi:hypothetical protein
MLLVVPRTFNKWVYNVSRPVFVVKRKRSLIKIKLLDVNDKLPPVLTIKFVEPVEKFDRVLEV